jgi:hypothetical protein
MTYRYLIFLFCCLLGLEANATTFSGTVYNASATSCGPMSGQKVFIGDSTKAYYDSTVTNSAGQYSFTLPTWLSTGASLAIYSTGCGALERYIYSYTGSNMTLDFILCGDQKHIVGSARLTVATSDSFNRGSTKTWLIQETVNPVTADTILTAIDSMVHGDTVSATSPGSPASFGFWRACIPAGKLLMKSALEPSNPFYSNYLPTYWTAPGTPPAFTWNKASQLTTTNWNVSGPVIYSNIHMIAGTNPGGPGFIGGSVLLGANKSTAVGDPLPHRILILTKSTDEPVAYTYTDGSGNFKFPSLPYGTYKLFGDVIGKNNPPMIITLSAGNDRVSNVVFEENSKEFTGRIGTTGITLNSLLTIKVSPNPVADNLTVDGLESIRGNKTLTLVDLTGAVVSKQSVNTGSAVLNLSRLAPGIYVLQVTTDDGVAMFRIAK